jgi:hypothetical protein
MKAYRDLNDPDGWRFSSLRKTLLLRFRKSLISEGMPMRTANRRKQELSEKCDLTIPPLQKVRTTLSMEFQPMGFVAYLAQCDNL